jgi:DNA-binding NtrC family response regulator
MVSVRNALKTRILVAGEESAVEEESIANWLEDAGYQVATVEIGERALKVVEHHDFDVVIVGVRLPGTMGVRVVRESDDNKPEVKSVIITGYPLMERAIEAVKLGAVDYLVGVQAPGDLELVIRETLLQREDAQYTAGDSWWRA